MPTYEVDLTLDDGTFFDSVTVRATDREAATEHEHVANRVRSALEMDDEILTVDAVREVDTDA